MCEAIPQSTCEIQHSVIDQMEDVDDIKILVTQVASTFSHAADKRQELNCYLEAVIASNSKSMKKLRLLAEKNQFSIGKMCATSAKKKLQEILQKAETEVEEAEKEWNYHTGSVKSKVYKLKNLALPYFCTFKTQFN